MTKCEHEILKNLLTAYNRVIYSGGKETEDDKIRAAEARAYLIRHLTREDSDTK